MNQTGEGALSADDLVALHAGFFVNLPPSTVTGQDILFVDRTKSLQSASRECRLRCLFYMFQVLSQKESSQTKGILIFILLIQPRVQEFDPEFAMQAVALMDKSFAVKTHFHLLNCLPKSGKRPLIQSIIQRAVGTLVESFPDYQLHTETSAGDLTALLKRLGLQIYGIPTGLGGNWKYEQHTKWCRKQAVKERGTMHNPPRASAATNRSGSSQDASASVAASVPPAEPAASSSSVEAEVAVAMTIEDRNERKRRINVIHSRQKRERRKAEQKILEDEVRSLKQKNALLVKEHEMLKAHVTKAQMLEYVSNISSTTATSSALQSGNPQSRIVGGASLETLATRLAAAQGQQPAPGPQGDATSLETLATRLATAESQQPAPAPQGDGTTLARLLAAQGNQVQLAQEQQLVAQQSDVTALARLLASPNQLSGEQLTVAPAARRQHQQLPASTHAAASVPQVGMQREAPATNDSPSFPETASQLMKKSAQERKMLLELLMLNNPNFGKTSASNPMSRPRQGADPNSTLGNTGVVNSSRSASLVAAPANTKTNSETAASGAVNSLLFGSRPCQRSPPQEIQHQAVQPSAMRYRNNAAIEEALRLMNQQNIINRNAAIDEALRRRSQQNDGASFLGQALGFGVVDNVGSRSGSHSFTTNALLNGALRNQTSGMAPTLAGVLTNNSADAVGNSQQRQTALSQLASLLPQQSQPTSALQQQLLTARAHELRSDQVSNDEMIRLFLAASALQGNRP